LDRPRAAVVARAVLPAEVRVVSLAAAQVALPAAVVAVELAASRADEAALRVGAAAAAVGMTDASSRGCRRSRGKLNPKSS
jgi:hypothetical protein